jgi:polyhydroxybutyrate depolymerase
MRVLGAVLLILAVTGCSSAAPRPSPAATGKVTGNVTVAVDSRPFALHVPASYGSTPVPLVVLLHGYTSNGAQQESYLQLTPESDRRGFLYAMPDGTKNAQDARFWNATDACCNFYGSTVDDSAYLRDLIRTVESTYHVDTTRVYVIGHSNGGFMAYRFACDHADQIAAIVSLAGDMWSDLSQCHPARPVSVVQLQGTADETINFNGGTQFNGASYPSAAKSVADWVGFDGCATTPDTSLAPKDLLPGTQGAETTVTAYHGCKGNASVQLWAMKDAPHVPRFAGSFAGPVMDWLYAQVSPAS